MSVENSSSLPQFDVTHYFSQVFWLFICFVVLVVFIKIVIIPRVDTALAKRASYIECIDDENRNAALSNSALETEIEYVRSTTNAKVAGIIASANEDAVRTVNSKNQMIENVTSENFKLYRSKIYDDVSNIEYFAKNEIDNLSRIVVDKIKNR